MKLLLLLSRLDYGAKSSYYVLVVIVVLRHRYFREFLLFLNSLIGSFSPILSIFGLLKYLIDIEALYLLP